MVYKANDLKCVTGDCRILTVKISNISFLNNECFFFLNQQIISINKQERGGSKRLACVGDPFSVSGSRCLPIEGTSFLSFYQVPVIEFIFLISYFF
jgi:hypothetical protein